jgi:hypothetical protein
MKNQQPLSFWISIYSPWSYSTLFIHLNVFPLIILNWRKEKRSLKIASPGERREIKDERL